MDDDKKDDVESHFFSLICSLITCDQIDYWIGNPSVELITGTIFFRKDEDQSQKKHLTLKNINFNEVVDELRKKEIETNILLVAPMPIDKNFFEFGDFIKDWENEILEMRIIQTSMSRSYGVLICFSSNETSQKFYWHFQGKKYNDLEPFICFLKEVINVKKIINKEKVFVLRSNWFMKEQKLMKKITSPL